MPEAVVCSWCGQPAAWNPRVWGWVCPEGEVISEQTGLVIGSIADSQPVAMWRRPGEPWPEDSEASDG